MRGPGRKRCPPSCWAATQPCLALSCPLAFHGCRWHWGEARGPRARDGPGQPSLGIGRVWPAGGLWAMPAGDQRRCLPRHVPGLLTRPLCPVAPHSGQPGNQGTGGRGSAGPQGLRPARPRGGPGTSPDLAGGPDVPLPGRRATLAGRCSGPEDQWPGQATCGFLHTQFQGPGALGAARGFGCFLGAPILVWGAAWSGRSTQRVPPASPLACRPLTSLLASHALLSSLSTPPVTQVTQGRTAPLSPRAGGTVQRRRQGQRAGGRQGGDLGRGCGGQRSLGEEPRAASRSPAPFPGLSAHHSLLHRGQLTGGD